MADKDKNGILTDDEVKNFKDEIATAAKNQTLSQREAKKYLKSQDLKEFKGDDLLNFLKNIEVISKKSNVENAKIVTENGNKQIVLTSNGGNVVETIFSDKTSQVVKKR